MNGYTNDDACIQRRTNLCYAAIGFGAGAIAGAGAALLLAPASGKETTAAIREKWDDVSDKVCDVCGEAKSMVSHAYDKTAAAVGNAKERLAGKKEASEKD